MKKQGLRVRDQRRASQIVRNITKVIDGIFPTALEASDKSAKGQKLKFFNDVNDLLIGGDLTKGVDEVKLGKILDDLKLKKLPSERLENLRDSLNAGRTELNNLIDIDGSSVDKPFICKIPIDGLVIKSRIEISKRTNQKPEEFDLEFTKD